MSRRTEVDDEAPVVPDVEPVVELDLDEPDLGTRPGVLGEGEVLDASEQTPAPADIRSRLRAWRPALVVGLIGALLGGGLVHVVQTSRARSETSLRVAIGESGARLLNRRLGTRRVILLSTLAVNEGSSGFTVRGVRVEGYGAGLTRTFRGEASIYPFRLEPGQTSNMPLAVTSDCAIEGRAVPRVTVDVTAEDGTERTVEVRIPGLEELWRRSTTTDACGTV